mgnify:FL=1
MTVSNTYTVTARPAKVDLLIYSGDDFLQTILIDEDGVAVVLTGSSFSMRINDNRGTTLLTISSPASGITIVGAGEIQIELTDTQTDALPVNCQLPYDLQWTNAAGTKKTLLSGNVIVQADITP